MFTIRPETPADHEAIARVVAAAFESDGEATLVDRIRSSDRFIPDLSIVAEIDGEVVGHVMVSYTDLDDGGTLHRVPIMAPVAVHPDHQRRGIGKALVRAGLDGADAMGEPMVVLEGGPKYYGALGFEHSVPHGIHFDLPDWAPAEAAQVYCLSAYDPTIKGSVVLPEAFEGLE
jgi:putative acetyltransferase